MENFDRENIDELLEIRQIRQYFPRPNFAPYGIYMELLTCNSPLLYSYQMYEGILVYYE